MDLPLRLALSVYTCPERCPLWGGSEDSETCISGLVGTEHTAPPIWPHCPGQSGLYSGTEEESPPSTTLLILEGHH